VTQRPEGREKKKKGGQEGRGILKASSLLGKGGRKSSRDCRGEVWFSAGSGTR